MKLIDFLKIFDGCGLYVIIYIEDEEDPFWEGSILDIPWYAADMYLTKGDWGEEPISYRSNLGKEYDNKPGLVICLKDSGRED